MRNLRQYPVTDEERVEVLTRLLERIMTDLAPGDLTAMVLQDAIKKFRVPTDEERVDLGVRTMKLQELHDYLRENQSGQIAYERWADAVESLLIDGEVSASKRSEG